MMILIVNGGKSLNFDKLKEKEEKYTQSKWAKSQYATLEEKTSTLVSTPNMYTYSCLFQQRQRLDVT